MYTILHFSNIGSTCTPIVTIENDSNVLNSTEFQKRNIWR